MSEHAQHRTPGDGASSDRLFGFGALLGLAASLLAHVAAICGVDVAAQLPLVWGLHVGTFLVLLPFVLSARKILGPKPGLARLAEIFPVWLFAVAVLLFIYAFINFQLTMSVLADGSPGERAGKLVLEDHGRLVREITESEYHRYKAYELRSFSGHWLLLYFVPFAYFLFRNGPRPAGSGSDSSDDGQRA